MIALFEIALFFVRSLQSFMTFKIVLTFSLSGKSLILLNLDQHCQVTYQFDGMLHLELYLRTPFHCARPGMPMKPYR